MMSTYRHGRRGSGTGGWDTRPARRVLGCVLAAALLTAGSAVAQEPGKQESEKQEPTKKVPRAPGQAAVTDASGATDASESADGARRADLLRTWARSYYPGRSGDLFLVPEEGEIVTAPGVPFMHGSPWDYDARVPVILYGPVHVRPGVYEAEASHQDLGATVEALLGLPRRPTTRGRALSEALAGPEAAGGVGSAGDGVAPSDDGRGAAAPPRTIVVLVLDGFRPDYLERYAEETSNLRGLAEGGAWFSRARTDVLPTATAVAHATLVTATDPALHGITGNTPFDRARGKSFNAYEGSSSRNVMVLTLADLWSAWTRGGAVIAVQGGAFYPATALAGHGGCIFGGRPVIMAFFDSRTGGWGSNPDCYELPGYLIDDNIQTLLSEVAARPAAEGDREAEGEEEVGRGREAADAASRRQAALFARFEGDATVEILETEAFGEDAVADLLLVNHKGIDRIGHAHGPGSQQMREAVAEVDRQVARILRALEEKVETGDFVLAVTADHGMPEEPGEDRRHLHAEVVAEVNGRFDPEGSGIVLHYEGADNQVYLDEARMEELGIAADEVARFLEGLPTFHAVFTEEEVRRAADEASEAAGPPAPEPSRRKGETRGASAPPDPGRRP